MATNMTPLEMQLTEALREVRSDLFYQLASKHGPEKASQYPSIVKADEALADAYAYNL